GDLARSIGVMAITLEDDAFVFERQTLVRKGVEIAHQIGFIEGDSLRDWTSSGISTAAFPYSTQDLQPQLTHYSNRLLWPYRSGLLKRLLFGKTQQERGLSWFEYGMLVRDKFRSPFSIGFAFVATHNHLVLDRGGNIFNRSAPIIKLTIDA